MSRRDSVLASLVLVAAALALIAPLAAQAPAGAPTADNPLRFTAVGINMQTRVSGTLQIAIERWTTDQERQDLVNILAQQGQDKLRDALQDTKARNGFLRTPNSMGWDIKYAKEFVLSDGTRQIVIVTDKPVSFFATVSQARVMDYPFTVIEMRFPKGKTEGEGKMLTATALSIKNGRLELENYGQESTRLTSIKAEKQKK